jgi:hypothetical protein
VDVKTGEIVIPKGTEYHASQGTLFGNAELGNCSACASKQVVYRLGAGGSVTIHNVTGTGEEQWVAVYYTNPDYEWRTTTVRYAIFLLLCSHDDPEIDMSPSVNGGPVQTLEQPDTQDAEAFLSVPIKLDLRNSTDNFITFGHNQTGKRYYGREGWFTERDSGYAGDLDKIIVYS